MLRTGRGERSQPVFDFSDSEPSYEKQPRAGKRIEASTSDLLNAVRFIRKGFRIGEKIEEKDMNGRPRTKASKKRRVRVKAERRLKKTLSRVMPMLSRRKKAKA